MRRQLLPLEFPRLTAPHLRALVNPALKQTDLLGRKIPGFHFIVPWRHRGFGILVDGSLDLSGASVKGSWTPAGTGITQLPDGLHVKGRLILDPETTVLPRGLRVDGHFGAFWSKISEIPNDAQFGGAVSFPSTLLKLPANMTVAGFSMAENPNITEWPPGFIVNGGDINLYNAQIKRLPDGFTAPNDLILSDSALEELPQNLRVGGKLDIMGTNLQLRDDIEVVGQIKMKVKSFRDIPEKFRGVRKIIS
jgi:hypothetical protein